MRYLRLIALFGFIYWTYSVFNKPLDVSILTHSYIQEDLRNIIKFAVEDALPDAKDIEFSRMNTENKNLNQVQANFLYGFTTMSEIGPHRLEIEGRAMLNRIEKFENGNESWSLDSIQLGNETIEFQEPVVIEVEI